MENTVENKSRFFAQYWGQKILIRNHKSEQYDDMITCSLTNWSGWENSMLLELKPLSAISDEDKKEIAKLLGYTGNNIKVEYEENGYRGFMLTAFNGSKKFILLNELPIIVGDYLRSKEYALPFHDLTVQQQIEYGWIKLTNQ